MVYIVVERLKVVFQCGRLCPRQLTGLQINQAFCALKRDSPESSMVFRANTMPPAALVISEDDVLKVQKEQEQDCTYILLPNVPKEVLRSSETTESDFNQTKT